MNNAKLIELDKALTAQNKGVFFGYDTDTAKKGSAKSGLWLRTVSRGFVANASTDYVRRVQAQNPDFKPGNSWHERRDGFKNLVFHPKSGEAYAAIPYRTDTPSNVTRQYYTGPSANGPWTPCTYEEGQAILTPSARDENRTNNNGSTVGFKTLKVGSLKQVRTGGRIIRL